MSAARAQSAPPLTGARRIHHVGITVSDLQRSLAFYRDLLGMRVLGRSGGEGIGDIVGVPGAAARIADLDAGNGQILELLDYGTGTSRPQPAAPDRVGTVHLSLEVADLDSALARLRAAGHAPIGEVAQLTEGGVWQGCTIVYLRDPDGVILELIERAAGPAIVDAPAVAVHGG